MAIVSINVPKELVHLKIAPVTENVFRAVKVVINAMKLENVKNVLKDSSSTLLIANVLLHVLLNSSLTVKLILVDLVTFLVNLALKLAMPIVSNVRKASSKTKRNVSNQMSVLSRLSLILIIVNVLLVKYLTVKVARERILAITAFIHMSTKTASVFLVRTSSTSLTNQ